MRTIQVDGDTMVRIPPIVPKTGWLAIRPMLTLQLGNGTVTHVRDPIYMVLGSMGDAQNLSKSWVSILKWSILGQFGVSNFGASP